MPEIAELTSGTKLDDDMASAVSWTRIHDEAMPACTPALGNFSLHLDWNRKRERRSVAAVRLRPQPATMPLDDAAADRKADPHPRALRCVERLEELFGLLRVDTDSRVDNRQPHGVIVLQLRPHQDLPCTIGDALHRVRCIEEQIEDDLLKLNAITVDVRKVVRELHLKGQPVSVKL